MNNMFVVSKKKRTAANTHSPNVAEAFGKRQQVGIAHWGHLRVVQNSCTTGHTTTLFSRPTLRRREEDRHGGAVSSLLYAGAGGIGGGVQGGAMGGAGGREGRFGGGGPGGAIWGGGRGGRRLPLPPLALPLG